MVIHALPDKVIGLFSIICGSPFGENSAASAGTNVVDRLLIGTKDCEQVTSVFVVAS